MPIDKETMLARIQSMQDAGVPDEQIKTYVKAASAKINAPNIAPMPQSGPQSLSPTAPPQEAMAGFQRARAGMLPFAEAVLRFAGSPQVGFKGLATAATSGIQSAAQGVNEQRTFGTPLSESGHPILGFVTDVALDPTTYMFGGAGKLAGAKLSIGLGRNELLAAKAAKEGISLPAEAVTKSGIIKWAAQVSKATDLFNIVNRNIEKSRTMLVSHVNDIVNNIKGVTFTENFGKDIGTGYGAVKKVAQDIYNNAYKAVELQTPKLAGVKVDTGNVLKNISDKTERYIEAGEGGEKSLALQKWLSKTRTLSEIRSKAEVIGEGVFNRATNKLVNPPAEDKILRSAVHDMNEALFNTLEKHSPSQALALRKARSEYQLASKTVFSEMFKSMPDLVNRGRWSEIGEEFVARHLEPEDIGILKQIKNQYGPQGQIFYDGIKASVVDGLLKKSGIESGIALKGEEATKALTRFSNELKTNKDIYEPLMEPKDFKRLSDIGYLKGVLDTVKDVRGSGKTTTSLATGALSAMHPILAGALLIPNTFLNSKLGQAFLSKGISNIVKEGTPLAAGLAAGSTSEIARKSGE